MSCRTRLRRARHDEPRLAPLLGARRHPDPHLDGHPTDRAMTADSAHRPLRLSLRVSCREREELARRAADCGTSVSDYLRQAALGSVPRRRPHRSEEELLGQLAGLASTLRRLARVAASANHPSLLHRIDGLLGQIDQTIRDLAHP